MLRFNPSYSLNIQKCNRNNMRNTIGNQLGISFVLKKKKKKKFLIAYYRGIGPRSPLFMYIMDLRPKPRTEDVRGG